MLYLRIDGAQKKWLNMWKYLRCLRQTQICTKRSSKSRKKRVWKREREEKGERERGEQFVVARAKHTRTYIDTDADTVGEIQLEMLGRCCMYILVCMYIEGIVLIDTTGTYAAGANCAALGSFSSSLPAVAFPSLVWLPLDITVSLPLLPLAASPFPPLPPLFWLQSAVLALDLWPTATLVRQTLWPRAASHATSARDKRSSFSCLHLPLPRFLPLCHPFHCFICVVVAKNRSNAHCIRLLCCRGYWTQYFVSKFCRRR